MSDRDYYEILGLTPRADGTMVDQAYWHLARKYQTLALTNSRARAMLDQLNEAYGVLGNPRLREQYDAFRDDVLIRKGMITPVASKPKRREPDLAAESRDTRTANRRLPSLRLPAIKREHYRHLGLGAVIAALALAAAWQGVNPAFVIGALALGLAMSLTPVLKRQLPDFSISLPAVSMPEIRAPRIEMPKLAEINVPKLREIGVGVPKDEPVGPDELRASTAAMISRWRNSVGLRPLAAEDNAAAAQPDRTLVEIVEAERDIERLDEPLAAVMDILRGGSATPRPVETK